MWHDNVKEGYTLRKEMENSMDSSRVSRKVSYSNPARKAAPAPDMRTSSQELVLPTKSGAAELGWLERFDSAELPHIWMLRK